ncbi:hypothetical protein [Lutibacter sp.]|uniref:hypothetical protein n=1 Tax=Lutibacter sp. TaxID=1925666 RepID=UPI0025B88F14|nr:hypothetical protein [Lutibacter sp.]MCF6180826.1 hypothetical protein [Lutibacter sp.]
MKKGLKLVIILCFLYNNSNAQRISIKRIESRLITNEGIEFIGSIKDKNRDLYIFQKWNNNGILFVNNKRYLLSNINFDITTNSFESRISRKKYFSFKNSEIDSVFINNLLFKKIGNSFYEVLFEKGNFLFLKKHDITYQKGIENRIDGSVGKSKALLSYKYLVKINNKFKKIELNKKNIISLFDDKLEREKLIQFVKKNKLSYRSLKDVIKIFKFLLNNSGKLS